MRVLFLLKNGIGYGHFQRALVVADHLKELKIEPYFICQANSLKIFEGTSYPVINLPFFHRLPNNLSEKIIIDLLNSLIEKINPHYIIEDTYPDQKYLSLTAVQHRKKILLLQKVDIFQVERIRSAGFFSQYEKVLCLQSKEEFLRSCPAPRMSLIARLSSKFEFIGPIYRDPKSEALARAEKLKGKFEGLVVVSAGAGGEHLDEGFCQRLYQTAIDAAADFPKHLFLIVKGIYFKGSLTSPQSMNIKILDYDPNLPAILQTASVCIFRPGYNTMHETLGGTAQIIAVPGLSYMENQRAWCQALKDKYSIQICHPLDKEALTIAIQKAIALGKAAPRIQNSASIFAQSIASMTTPNVRKRRPLFILFKNAPPKLSEHLRKRSSVYHFEATTSQEANNGLVYGISQIIHEKTSTSLAAIYDAPQGEVISPARIESANISILFFPEDPEGEYLRSAEYAGLFMPEAYSIICCPLPLVSGHPNECLAKIPHFLGRQTGAVSLCIDGTDFPDTKKDLEEFTSALEKLFLEQDIEPASLSEWGSCLVAPLENLPWQVSFTELKKLKE